MRLIALELAPLTLGKDDNKARDIQNLRKSSRFTPPPLDGGKWDFPSWRKCCILIVVDVADLCVWQEVMQFSSVSKLFLLPPQPEYLNSWQVPSLLL